jgi:hypothetical protein
LAHHGPLATHAQDDVTSLEPALRPETLERGAHGGWVTYLTFDHRTRRQANLSEAGDPFIPAVTRDLYGSYC